jgi:ubiquinol-cytochrome c reductase iron-sulfur subunit
MTIGAGIVTVTGSGGVNKQRRYFLIGATSVVGGLGVVGAAVPFVASWSPSARARALGAPIRINIAKLKPGEMLGPIPGWRGKPVFVLYRTPEALQVLEHDADQLQDPNSERPQQPKYAQNTWRSRRPEIGVYLGLCTHLGCSPKYFGKVEPQQWDPNWKGGFFCPCHGSVFDLAGRVAKGVPAPANLEVPPYSFDGDDVIVIGIDEETA